MAFGIVGQAEKVVGADIEVNGDVVQLFNRGRAIASLHITDSLLGKTEKLSKLGLAQIILSSDLLYSVGKNVSVEHQ